MALTLEFVAVGTELLLGETVDTNAVHAGRALAAHGITVARRATVGDRPDEIMAAVGAALERTGTVIVCGGLGPTQDDLTRDAVATLLGAPLEFREEIWQELVERWRRHGRPLSESNRTQAMVPRGGTVLPNRWGSAPGLWLEGSRGVVILLPGVPREFRNLMDSEVLPRLVARGGDLRTVSRVLRTTAIPESRLGELVGPLESSLLPVTVAYLPEQTGVDLRLTAWQCDAAEAAARLDRAEAAVRSVANRWIYASGSTDLAEVLLAELRVRGLTLATAESCTGGMVGGRITAIPGSSAVYQGGAICYADSVKAAILGVDPTTLVRDGAVSEAVAREMAIGAARRFDADVTLAVTGVAGPDGGTEEKPVGTVWFAWSRAGRVEAEQLAFSGDRGQVRERAAQAALWGLLQRIRG